MAPKTEAQKKAQKKYIQSVKRIGLYVTPEAFDAIQKAAQAAGMSVNEYAKKALAAQMSRDAQSAPL